MRYFKLRKTNSILLIFIILLYLEVSFKILTNNPVLNISLLYIVIFDIFFSFLLGNLTTIFKSSINKIVLYIFILFVSGISCLNFCCYKIFSFFFDLSLLNATDQVLSFTGDMFVLVLQNIFGVMLLLFPLFLLVINSRYIKIHKSTWQEKLIGLCICLLSIIAFLGCLHIKKNEEYSAYKLYYKIESVDLSIRKFGVVHGFFLDIYRNVFGFEESLEIGNPIIIETPEENSTEEEKYDFNHLSIDFDSLIEDTKDETIKGMHEYFKNDAGTKQNRYTGFFKDKNLILFMAESFNEIAVSEELTPTLYKLVNNGFVFPNFYTPTISSTIGGEFQELTGLVATSGFLGPWKSGMNAYPFGIATMFKNIGYNTYAYHDHNYTFQNRNKYLSALGFDNFKGCRNGLENLINCKQWPESDLEMINATTSDYMNSKEPFFTYYVTVSGHGDYGFASTAMGRKHKSEVEHLPYSEKVLSYLAANIELDKALETLINELEKNGKLDDTVIALVGDHYPYYLTTEEVNEVASYKKDGVVEINHSNFILWNNKMENVVVEKVGSQIDVLPTIYNLFGLEYDSRLIMGRDILSTEPGLAIFGNRSWVSDYGTYFSASGKFIPKEGKELDNEYVSKMNIVVANRMNMSKLIMEQDYYKYIK